MSQTNHHDNKSCRIDLLNCSLFDQFGDLWIPQVVNAAAHHHVLAINLAQFNKGNLVRRR